MAFKHIKKNVITIIQSTGIITKKSVTKKEQILHLIFSLINNKYNISENYKEELLYELRKLNKYFEKMGES